MIETVTLQLPSEIVDVIRKYAKRIIVESQFSTDTVKEKQASPLPTVENFEIPSYDDVVAECKRLKSPVNPRRFIAYYTAKNWTDKDGMPFDWKEKLQTWGTYNLEKTPVATGKVKAEYGPSVTTSDVKKFLEGL